MGNFLKEYDLELTGFENTIINNSGKVIGITKNSHYTEGLIKSLHTLDGIKDKLENFRSVFNSENDKSVIVVIDDLLESIRL